MTSILLHAKALYQGTNLKNNGTFFTLKQSLRHKSCFFLLVFIDQKVSTSKIIWVISNYIILLVIKPEYLYDCPDHILPISHGKQVPNPILSKRCLKMVAEGQLR